MPVLIRCWQGLAAGEQVVTVGLVSGRRRDATEPGRRLDLFRRQRLEGEASSVSDRASCTPPDDSVEPVNPPMPPPMPAGNPTRQGAGIQAALAKLSASRSRSGANCCVVLERRTAGRRWARRSKIDDRRRSRLPLLPRLPRRRPWPIPKAVCLKASSSRSAAARSQA